MKQVADRNVSKSDNVTTLSNRVFEDYDAIIDAGCDAWNRLVDQPETIKSIGMRKWAHIGQN